MLEFRILGPLEVLRGGVPVQLGGPRQRATLALLLLHANRVVSIDHLAEELYAGRPPVTAVTQVQRQVSELRKLLGEDAIETRPPGYLVHVPEDAFDLAQFERLAAQGTLGALREALSLWRGEPLADLAFEQFVQAPLARLQDLRLAALEERLHLELETGAAAQVAAELELLVAEHPLRERFRALQMRALERSGRHADALAAYRDAHRTLVREVGIEPSPALQRLADAIRAGELPGDEARPRTVVAVSVAGRIDALAVVARALGNVDLVAIGLVDREDEVPTTARAIRVTDARTAAFTTTNPAADVVRLATANDAELVLVDDLALTPLFESSPATVGIVAGGDPEPGRGVAVPFGGGEHEWAALELAAQLAPGSISLVGMRAQRGRRDASRLLADASLALQRIAKVDVIPVLVDDVVAAVHDAGLVVAGVSPRWRSEGIGAARSALIAANVATLLVHRGPRPSGLAPQNARTLFTWSAASA